MPLLAFPVLPVFYVQSMTRAESLTPTTQSQCQRDNRCGTQTHRNVRGKCSLMVPVYTHTVTLSGSLQAPGIQRGHGCQCVCEDFPLVGNDCSCLRSTLANNLQIDVCFTLNLRICRLKRTHNIRDRYYNLFLYCTIVQSVIQI